MQPVTRVTLTANTINSFPYYTVQGAEAWPRAQIPCPCRDHPDVVMLSETRTLAGTSSSRTPGRSVVSWAKKEGATLQKCSVDYVCPKPLKCALNHTGARSVRVGASLGPTAPKTESGVVARISSFLPHHCLAASMTRWSYVFSLTQQAPFPSSLVAISQRSCSHFAPGIHAVRYVWWPSSRRCGLLY